MSQRSDSNRLERLEQIVQHLKQEGYCKVVDLADVFNVSVRTITRDIQILRERGLPIDADRGRGGGILLDQRWGVGRVNLNYTEAIDLLVSLAIAEQMNSPLFLAQLKSIRHKLMASFSPDKKSKIQNLKSRILIGESASSFVLSSFDVSPQSAIAILHQAFVMQQNLKISYEAENGQKTSREIEPHYLLLNYPVWYVLSWDHLRNAPRTFRCDRIAKSESLQDKFKLQPIDIFKDSLADNIVI